MKVFYLKDTENNIISKFEMTSDDIFQGRAYECVGWDGKTNEPIDWLFHSEVYAKFDGCSHWWFRGEDYNENLCGYNHDGSESYYHICCSFNNFIRTMCFVWRLAGNYHIKLNSCDLTREEYNLDIVDYMLKDYEILESEVN